MPVGRPATVKISVTTESTAPELTTTVSQGSGSNRYGPGAQVVVKGGALEQEELVVAVGTAVKFVNAEPDDSDIRHRLVADDGSFDTGELVPGDTYDFTFQTPGTFAFTDQMDPNIKGTIIVQ